MSHHVVSYIALRVCALVIITSRIREVEVSIKRVQNYNRGFHTSLSEKRNTDLEKTSLPSLKIIIFLTICILILSINLGLKISDTKKIT